MFNFLISSLYCEPLIHSKKTVFSPSEFDSAFKKAEATDLEGWQYVFTSKDGLQIYKRQKSKGLYEYLGFGELEGLSPAKCFQLYMDIEYRKKWDKEHVVSAQIVATEPSPSTQDHPNSIGSQIIHWVTKYPWPFKNRDYVYLREARSRNGSYAVLSKSIDLAETHHAHTHSHLLHDIDENHHPVRVNDYSQLVVFRPHPHKLNSSLIFIQYFDNPRGSLPTSVTNWVAKSAIPTFIHNLKKAGIQGSN